MEKHQWMPEWSQLYRRDYWGLSAGNPIRWPKIFECRPSRARDRIYIHNMPYKLITPTRRSISIIVICISKSTQHVWPDDTLAINHNNNIIMITQRWRSLSLDRIRWLSVQLVKRFIEDLWLYKHIINIIIIITVLQYNFNIVIILGTFFFIIVMQSHCRNAILCTVLRRFWGATIKIWSSPYQTHNITVE